MGGLNNEFRVEGWRGGHLAGSFVGDWRVHSLGEGPMGGLMEVPLGGSPVG